MAGSSSSHWVEKRPRNQLANLDGRGPLPGDVVECHSSPARVRRHTTKWEGADLGLPTRVADLREMSPAQRSLNHRESVPR